MNEPTVARTSGGEGGWIGWPDAAARPHVAATGRLPAPAEPELLGVDRVEVGRGDSLTRAYATFAFNEKTDSVSIRIVDPRTDEVIREIPPERVALIAEELQALARRTAPGGRLFDGVADGPPSIPVRGVDQYV